MLYVNHRHHDNMKLLFQCRGCGEGAEVAAADFTYVICQACCEHSIHPDGDTGHDFEYVREERDWPCKYCGASAPDEFYSDYWDPY